MRVSGWLALVGALPLLGCATVFEGTNQQVVMKVSPESAKCSVTRKGVEIASLSGGTSTVTIDKSRNAVFLECSAPGYQAATLKVDSSATGWGVAGCFLFDLCITDYSTGALNEYPDAISVALKPDTGIAEATNAANSTIPADGGQPTMPTSMGSTKANPATPPAPIASAGPWYTKSDTVHLYAEPADSSPSVQMPSHVPLTLVKRVLSWGQFQYQAADGSQAQGWILMANVQNGR